MSETVRLFVGCIIGPVAFIGFGLMIAKTMREAPSAPRERLGDEK